MRKLFGILAVVLIAAACTPEQAREFARKLHEVQAQAAKEEVRVSRPPPTRPNTFLVSAAALHNDPFLACTRAHESDTAGGYQARSPDGLYLGAYQFLQSTWDNTARHAGLYFLVGQYVRSVHPYWQDVVAMSLYRWQGKAPWGYRC